MVEAPARLCELSRFAMDRAFLILWLLTVAAHAAEPTPVVAKAEPTADTLRNRPELSRPLLDRKLIIAHHMTAWVGHPDIPRQYFSTNPVPTGGADAVVGTKSVAFMFGMVRRPPLIELQAAVRHEIRSAVRMGLDGFQFFYPIHMHDGFLRRYSLIVKTFIQQAEQHHPDFRVTLCLCAPTTPASPLEMREQWAEHIRWILQDTSSSPIWLRSPDGRLIFYTWVPDGLVPSDASGKRPHIHSREGIAAAALAYEQLARAIGERIAYIYHMRGVDKDWYADLIFDYFPAAWRWVEGDVAGDTSRLSRLAQRRQRLFSPSVYPGFYGHTYRGDDHNANGSGEVGRDPIGELWRPYEKTAQTALYRRLLQSAIDTDARLISYITWNDITEATHLIPGVNNNFTLGVLLNHYRNEWLGQPDKNNRELAIVAYKKHRLDQPLATDVGYHAENPEDFGSMAEESRIEIVTALKSSAEVHLNGRLLGKVNGGLQSITAPFAAGPVEVSVRRNNREILKLEPSEWCTETPRRNDPVSYMLSTEFNRYFRDLFGPDAIPYRLREYAR